MRAVIFLLVLVSFSCIWACEYRVQDFKLDTCNGKPSTAAEFKNVSAHFTKDCGIKINGCVKINRNVKTATMDYTGSKDGIQLFQGSSKACGENLFGTVIKCPVKQGTQYCANERWVVPVPRNLIGMALGYLSGTGTVRTDVGSYCYRVSAKVRRV